MQLSERYYFIVSYNNLKYPGLDQEVTDHGATVSCRGCNMTKHQNRCRQKWGAAYIIFYYFVDIVMKIKEPATDTFNSTVRCTVYTVPDLIQIDNES